MEVDNNASNIDVKKKQAPRIAVNLVIKLAVPLAVINPPLDPPEPPIPNPPPNPDAPNQPPRRETTPVPLPSVGLGKDQMDVVSRLMKDRVLLLGSEVNDDVANIMVAQMLYLASADPEAEICGYTGA